MPQVALPVGTLQIRKAVTSFAAHLQTRPLRTRVPSTAAALTLHQGVECRACAVGMDSVQVSGLHWDKDRRMARLGFDMVVEARIYRALSAIA